MSKAMLNVEVAEVLALSVLVCRHVHSLRKYLRATCSDPSSTWW